MIYIYQTGYVLKKGERLYQKEHRIGRMLLRDGLKKWYGLDLTVDELEESLVEDPYGKPRFRECDSIHFNISHCDGIVVCAFSEKEIGIDVEKIQDFKETMVKKILTEKEQQILQKYEADPEERNRGFYRFWTLKESYLKWRGRGFYQDPLLVEFTGEAFAKGAEECVIECSDQKAAVIQKVTDTGYILSVCFEKGNAGDIIYEEYKGEAL